MRARVAKIITKWTGRGRPRQLSSRFVPPPKNTSPLQKGPSDNMICGIKVKLSVKKDERNLAEIRKIFNFRLLEIDE